MKIADVSEFYAERGGGVKTYTQHKLRAASAAGHELVVVAPGARDGEEPFGGGRIVWVKSPPMPLDPRYHVFVSRAAVHAVLAREQPDVIEGSSVWSGGVFAGSFAGAALKALIFHQDPVAVYPHTFLDGVLSSQRIDRLCEPYWGYLRRLAREYDVTVTAGAWLAQRLRDNGVDNARPVSFGSDTTAFSPALRDPALRAELLARTGTPSEGQLLVAVARHHPEKRLHTLCEAVRLVRARRPVGLVIFGDGPFRWLVDRWARQAGGVHVAGFTSNRQELARALASADALLHGSAAETYGIAVAEALSSGLPVIVPDRGGAAELADASCAELYPPGDADACARAIERLLDRPRAVLSLAAGVHAARAVRDLDHHFRDLFALYGELLAGPRELRGGSAAR
jgi:alpha-1,6-mannosyltransferase